jgi:predicted RND superfamily exporter protein
MAWIRGSIGLLDLSGASQLLGGPIRERVYILIALSNCVVQGVSFSLHKFETYNREGSWPRAKVVDTLLYNTAAIAFFGFITLWTFEVRSIRELGLLSALGVVYLLILAAIFIPSLGFMKPANVKERTRGHYTQFVEYLSNTCARLARWDPRFYLASTAGLVVLAVGLMLSGRLLVGTRPLEYIPGTLPDRTAQFLNEEGRSGFAPVSIYVESTHEYGIYDPGFLTNVAAYEQQLRKLGSRKVISVVDLVQKLSTQLYGVKMPLTSEEVEDIFFYLEEGTYPEVRYQSWTSRGVRILAFMAAEGSVEVGRFNDAARELASESPNFEAYHFGEMGLYPREDAYIRTGKPKNAALSEIVVIFFCVLLIVQKSRKLRMRRLSPLLGGLVMSVPFVFASSVTFLLMMALQIPLDVATAMITALAINASIDFSIYYVDAYQDALVKNDKNSAISVAMKDKGEVILNDILLNSVCFAPLILSHFVPISRLGWMMVVMITACGFGALVVMSSILRLAVDRNLERAAPLDGAAGEGKIP